MTNIAVRLANRFLAKRNLQIARVPRTHDMDREFFGIAEKCRPYTMTSFEACYALYGAVRHVIDRNIPGAFVECGVWKGGSCLLMAETVLLFANAERDIYLYDTFAGLPEPGKEDIRASSNEPAVEKWKASQKQSHNEWCYSPLEEVKSVLSMSRYPAERFKLVQGKVEDTIPATVPDRISILRLDTDWYESTKHELEHLFPLISPGGIVIIDDYGVLKGARKATDEFIGQSGLDIFLNRVDFSVRMFVVPHGKP